LPLFFIYEQISVSVRFSIEISTKSWQTNYITV